VCTVTTVIVYLYLATHQKWILLSSKGSPEVNSPSLLWATLQNGYNSGTHEHFLTLHVAQLSSIIRRHLQDQPSNFPAVSIMPSVLWRCWLGGRKGIRTVKNECVERGADLHVAQLMPLPFTVSHFSKIQIGSIFLVPAHRVVPDKGPLNVCVSIIRKHTGATKIWCE